MIHLPGYGELRLLGHLYHRQMAVVPLANALDVSETLIRRHIENLKHNGYIELFALERITGGTGRPKGIWTTTPLGNALVRFCHEHRIGIPDAQPKTS